MSKLKNITAIFTSSIMCLSSVFTSTVFANSIENSTELSDTDVIVASSLFLNSDNEDENILKSGSNYESIIPLYSLNNEVIAYYITFTTGAHAVVNNNLNNPTVIEFGDGVNEEIDKILSTNSETTIVYCSPFDVFEKNASNLKSNVMPLNQQYTYLDEINNDLVNQFETQKEYY